MNGYLSATLPSKKNCEHRAADINLERFSNHDGDGSENVTINMNSRFFLNAVAIIATRFKCQM